MPTLRLYRDGFGRPLVDVEVKPSVPQQEAWWAPPNQVPSRTVPFLVDTGSTHCCISKDVIAPLHLPMRNIAAVTQAGHDDTTEEIIYDLALRLHIAGLWGGQPWFHPVVEVSTLPSKRFEKAEFSGCIGMDLLRLGRLVWDGQHFDLSWT